MLPGSPFAAPARIPTAHERVAPGDRVTHDRLGLGRVVQIVDDHEVTVDFGREDGALTAVSHLKLTKL